MGTLTLEPRGDIWAELKSSLWLGCGLAAGFGVHVGLDRLFS